MRALLTYFNLAVRNFMHAKIYSLITALGLGIGMAAAILLFIYVDYEHHYDEFPEKANIYRVYNESNGESGVIKDANSHSAAGPALKELSPDVVDYTRVYTMANNPLVARTNDTAFPLSDCYVVDEGFLRMFPFAQVRLINSPLSKPYSVVLTETLAKKYFNTSDAIGKTIELSGHGMEGSYTVTGVLRDIPANTHFKFSMLISYATKYAQGHKDNWDNYWDYNYIQLRDQAEPSSTAEILSALARQHTSSSGLALKLQPLEGLHLDSDLTYELSPNANRKIVDAVFIIAVMILLVACINYVNITTARSLVRAREVGIRRVLGADKWQVALQFLTDAFFQNIIAVTLAFAIAQALLPAFGELAGRTLTFQLHGPVNFPQLVIILFLLGVLISGTYPALMLSAVNAPAALRGELNTGKRGVVLRKSLVIMQFMISALLIAGTFMMYLQITFMLKQPLGADITETLVIKAPIAQRDSVFMGRLRSFSHEIRNLVGVKQVASSFVIPGQNVNAIAGSTGMWREGDTSVDHKMYYFYDVDENFFPLYDIAVIAGRNFYQDGSDVRRSVILNMAAVDAFGFRTAEDAVGKHIVYGNERQHRLTIAGVVNNFHIQSLKTATAATMYYYRPVTENPLLSVKLNSPDVSSAITSIRKTWEIIFPDQPFEYNFADQKFGEQYAEEKRYSFLLSAFSIVGLVIACMGLFGLVSFATIRRLKEIGIRKVLGATTGQIIQLFSMQFLRLVMIACAISTPLIWFVADRWLSSYASRVEITPMFFVLPFVALLMISLLTIIIAALRPAQSNPVDSLGE